jgi:hypothetical protein
VDCGIESIVCENSAFTQVDGCLEAREINVSSVYGAIVLDVVY